MPFKYLGVAISASKLSIMDYHMLVDKITAGIKIWRSRHLSYTARITLINLVVIGTTTFGAHIFVLSQSVMKK